MDDKLVCQITVLDIAQRMLAFHSRDEIAEAADYAEYNAGTCDALKEMCDDMKNLTQTGFIEKYDEISLIKGANCSVWMRTTQMHSTFRAIAASSRTCSP